MRMVAKSLNGWLQSRFRLNLKPKTNREKVQPYADEEKKLWEDFRHGIIIGTKEFAARGLCAILEACLLDTMLELPSLANGKECIVDEETILKNAGPLLIYESVKQHA